MDRDVTPFVFQLITGIERQKWGEFTCSCHIMQNSIFKLLVRSMFGVSDAFTSLHCKQGICWVAFPKKINTHKSQTFQIKQGVEFTSYCCILMLLSSPPSLLSPNFSICSTNPYRSVWMLGKDRHILNKFTQKSVLEDLLSVWVYRIVPSACSTGNPQFKSHLCHEALGKTSLTHTGIKCHGSRTKLSKAASSAKQLRGSLNIIFIISLIQVHTDIIKIGIRLF